MCELNFPSPLSGVTPPTCGHRAARWARLQCSDTGLIWLIAVVIADIRAVGSGSTGFNS